MLTVVFATRNRAASLGRVLESFAALQAPPGGWKLVVVDNGSVDGTSDVLRAHALRLPLTVIQESRPGKTIALNAALGSLQGDITIQTDDDVLPCADWLVQYRRAADAHPVQTLFGGTVEPDWPGTPPRWIAATGSHHAILYARCRHPPGPCALSAIYGPNWAVRTSVFVAGMRFNEAIGPDSTRPSYAMGSETEFIGRLDAAGHRGWFVPEAAVRHIIRPEQLTERWILDRAYQNGLGVGITGTPSCATGPSVNGVPVRLLARAAVSHCLAAVLRPCPLSSLRLHVLFQERWFSGLVESWRRHHGTAAPPDTGRMIPGAAR